MKKFIFSIDGNKFEVSVNENENNNLDVTVNGSDYNVVVDREGTKEANATAVKTTTTKAAPAAAKTPGKVAPITPAAPTPATPAAAKGKTVKSQLPGSIIKVVASEGQAVKRGETVMTIESMKMENSIAAEEDGVITKIYVEPGKNVMQDDKLFDIQPSATATPATAPAAKSASVATKPVVPAAPVAAATKPAGEAKPLKSPLPGSIVKILVTEGQAIKRGDTILTMESMKMENEIKAEKDCVIVAIKVTPGQNVMQDDTLVMLG